MSSQKTAGQPEIRILHHMARSGGTIISRCLGCMKDIYLLSEIHPRGVQYYNPLAQAHDWYRLLTQGDIQTLKGRADIDFVDAVALINQRCADRGGILVIRDWNHVDFTGWPHFPDPSYRLETVEFLRSRFQVVHTATVRHPIDQWLSFRKSQGRGGASMPLGKYLEGYRRFAEQALDMGFVRYEDFVNNSTVAMQAICNNLQLPYDHEFQVNWTDYRHFTTDTRGRSSGASIGPRPRPPLTAEELGCFCENPDYQKSLDILGYSHPL